MATNNDSTDPYEYYRENYEVVAAYRYETGDRIDITHQGIPRTCRFCNKTEPQAEFRHTAHAIPEFFGNKCVFLIDECDACNSRFGTGIEDHLAKWSHLPRSLMKVKGKKRYPTFKSKSFRIDPENNNLQIRYLDQSVTKPNVTSLPFDFTLGGDTGSQSYIPLYAALALIKIAVSLCPPPLVKECDRAIHWLNNPQSANVTGMRVMFAFTPGGVPPEASHAILLRRKTSQPIPFLWLVLQCRNIRLQIFVPMCRPDDHWWKAGATATVNYIHYPSIFDEQWPFGRTEFSFLDWSSTDATRNEASAAIRFVSFNPGENRHPDE